MGGVAVRDETTRGVRKGIHYNAAVTRL